METRKIERSKMNTDLRVDGERLWHSIMAMAEIGPGEKGGSRRLALSDEDRQGRDLFVDWCEDIGCSIELDDMGNIFARKEGRRNDLPPIVSGSHLDTQPHGGKFDGIYGVLAALEVFRCLHDHNIETEAPLEIVVWTNEEGSRFAPAMMGSGVFAGLFDKQWAWSRLDHEGKSLGEELDRIGYRGDAQSGQHVIGALLEAHIEQGPILEAENKQIGVVVGAQGQRWYDLKISGQDSHAGSTPMLGRRDALVASAKVVALVNSIALQQAPDGVGTVGELSVKPNSRNTIPGEVILSVDMRHPDAASLDAMDAKLREQFESIIASHSLSGNVEQIWHKEPITFDSNCTNAIESATQQLGYAHQRIVSGAGHDACQICQIAPTGMIFVPCADGLSHNELESAEPADLAAGCNVLLQAMLTLANQP